MANLIAKANGNLSSASTWGLVDTTSLNDTEATTTVITTSLVASTTFIPGAITIDGFACKFANRAVSPSGTLKAVLRNTTDAVDVGSVTINISDIPADSVTNNHAGWIFFSLGSQTLIAGKSYAIQLQTSVAAQISGMSLATTNWARMLRTTTTQAPAAADQMVIAGEWTAAATQTARTVTMDSTSLATSYGNISICLGGTMTWGTTASTNYALSLAGLLKLYGGGTYNMGTSGTRMPSTSSAILEFACTSNVQFGAELYGGAFNAYGATLTAVQAKLAADASASATALTTDISTGWKNGNTVAIATTTRTNTECETKALGADASGTSIPTIAALTNAHGGNSTTGVQAEIIVLDRNVKIRGISTTFQSYVTPRSSCNFTANYVEFTQLGSGVGGKQGLVAASVTTTTGVYDVEFCSFHDFIVSGSQANGTFGYVNVIFQNNVGYNISQVFFSGGTAFSGSSSVTDNTVILVGDPTQGGISYTVGNNAVPFNRNTLAGGRETTANQSQGNFVISSGTNANGIIASNCDGNVAHGCAASSGINLNGSNLSGAIQNFKTWRNNSWGLSIASNCNLTVINLTTFGNTTAGAGNQTTNTSGGLAGVVRWYGCSFQAGVTLTQPIGLQCNNENAYPAAAPLHILDSCVFGTVQTHGTYDIDTGARGCRIIMRNCSMASTTEFRNTTGTNQGPAAYIQLEKHDQTSGNNKTFYREGTISIDTTIYDTSPSQRLTPVSVSSPAAKMLSSPIRVPVASGQTVTLSVKVRQSVIGDGATYNGSFPRVILETNGALGVTADVVGATGSAAGQGAFETLTYTSPTASEDGVFTFYVDCDGSTGWINIDTITAT